ncbi:DUF6515 family protein [Sphingobacterium siyangense]|uniref:Uncharacterized protein n=1 Tax=Sphingobacterium siyangense TaxID=459529 RepID=A0A562MGT7_9SPHI|nr:DUF6515 family protein [Sphingobacterium siyangense]TWI19155.1 hypothetical protein IQ31_02901 [Sphingobacterium siyangense]
MKNQKLFITLLLCIGLSSSVFAQRAIYTRNVSVVKRVPSTSALVVHGGINYHYYNGVYYKPYNGAFAVVVPPVGIHVNVLPVGYTTVLVGGRSYFYFDSTYYLEVQPNVYEVVAVPTSNKNNATAEILPKGAKVVVLNGKRYYKVDETYYEKQVSENGDITYKVVGKMQP